MKVHLLDPMANVSLDALVNSLGYLFLDGASRRYGSRLTLGCEHYSRGAFLEKITVMSLVKILPMDP